MIDVPKVVPPPIDTWVFWRTYVVTEWQCSGGADLPAGHVDLRPGVYLDGGLDDPAGLLTTVIEDFSRFIKQVVLVEAQGLDRVLIH